MIDKSAKFRALANKRVNKALVVIRQVGNLSNRATYQYTSDEVNRVFEVLLTALEEAQDRFASKKEEKKDEFQL